ncbi:MAG: tetratricopeptide repeat protein [Opitutaceae bacterium]|nr:tetratricopeptide repeat protein [Opitutaceae bacterium]
MAGWLLFSLLAICPVRAAGDLSTAWQALADYRAAEAVRIFERAAKADDPATVREARFGRAVALLARQPIEPAQIEAARVIFAGLAGEENSDIALAARFYLARIAQHHAAQPDEAAAVGYYRQIIELQPESIWAQTALSRLAILQIYPLDAVQSPAERISRTEKLLDLARGPAAQCELHWLLAEAVFFYQLPAVQALPHLLAAEKLGRLDAVAQADVTVQIAEVSVIAGDVEQARTFYQKLLDGFPRDQRRFMVQQKLAALDGK